MKPLRPGWLVAASIPLLAGLLAMPRPGHAQSALPSGPPGAQDPGKLAMFCMQTLDDSYDRNLWFGEDLKESAGAQLMELKWLPVPGREQRGTIECIYAPRFSRWPYPKLHGRFQAFRPDAPGWMRPSPTVDWLLCSGATMTHFDASQCPFLPAEPLPLADQAATPFGPKSP